MDATAKPLNPDELSSLTAHERVIKQGLSTFVEVGKALMAIRDGKLYRVTHRRFADYCNDKWSMDKRHANRLIQSAEVIEDLGPLGPILPTSERQTRPIAAVPKEDRPRVWEQVVETAPRDEQEQPIITASHVAQVVKETAAEPERVVIAMPPDSRVVGAVDELSGETFGTIYADPPWQYGNQGTRAATDNHYATMTVDELCAMPVAELAAPDAHLHLWTTNAFLFDAKRVMEAWGFEYRSCFVWVKTQMGIGNYWRVSHEFLLLGIRGNAKRFNNRSLKSWGEFDRGKHSSKPEQIRGYVESASPGPYLELFGRQRIAGWTVLGNQVEERLFA